MCTCIYTYPCYLGYVCTLYTYANKIQTSVTLYQNSLNRYYSCIKTGITAVLKQLKQANQSLISSIPPIVQVSCTEAACSFQTFLCAFTFFFLSVQSLDVEEAWKQNQSQCQHHVAVSLKLTVLLLLVLKLAPLLPPQEHPSEGLSCICCLFLLANFTLTSCIFNLPSVTEDQLTKCYPSYNWSRKS